MIIPEGTPVSFGMIVEVIRRRKGTCMYIIGIAGGSGSGKSTFSRRIRDAFGDEVAVLRSDNYYLPHDDIPLSARARLNYDAPEAIDFALMVQHIHALKAGTAIDCPVYDFTCHTRSVETTRMCPPAILILDGILLYAHDELRNLIDLKIYVDADADERILRRARRDMRERGRTIDSVIEQYVTTVKPMHYLYVEPTRAYADIIVNGGLNATALDLVIGKIRQML